MTFKMHFYINFGLFWSPLTALGTPWPSLHLSISASYFIHIVLQVDQKTKLALSLVEACFDL